MQGYAGRLGEKRMDRNNFSFESFDDLKPAGVSSLVAEVAEVFESDPENPVRYVQGAV